MNDFIYYIMVDGEVMTENIFSSEDEVREFAESHGYKKYHIVKWDVD